MAAATGDLALAEDTIWPEYFANPNDSAARWALWEIYDTSGSEWATQATGWCLRTTAARNGSRIASISGNAIAVTDARDGTRVATLHQVRKYSRSSGVPANVTIMLDGAGGVDDGVIGQGVAKTLQEYAAGGEVSERKNARDACGA